MDWSEAFARQACSDFAARDRLLQHADIPSCHQLHYLQMAMEKTAKAHLIAGKAEPLSLQSSHAYIAKVIPTIVRDALGRTPGAKAVWLMDAVAALARRIELLHPAVDQGGVVPSNCEYPWSTANGALVVPAEHDFPRELHAGTAAIKMIKVVRARATELAGLSTLETSSRPERRT